MRELNITQEKVLAWFVKTPKVSLKSILLADLEQTTPRFRIPHPVRRKGPAELRTQLRTLTVPTHQHNFLHPESETHPRFRDTKHKLAPSGRRRR